MGRASRHSPLTYDVQAIAGGGAGADDRDRVDAGQSQIRDAAQPQQQQQPGIAEVIELGRPLGVARITSHSP